MLWRNLKIANRKMLEVNVEKELEYKEVEVEEMESNVEERDSNMCKVAK